MVDSVQMGTVVGQGAVFATGENTVKRGPAKKKIREGGRHKKELRAKRKAEARKRRRSLKLPERRRRRKVHT